MLMIWQDKLKNRNERDTPNRVGFVTLSTSHISFKCFQPCQTKAMFVAKSSHFAVYSHVPISEHIFHTQNTV